MSWYSPIDIIHKKELKHLDLEILAVYGVLTGTFWNYNKTLCTKLFFEDFQLYILGQIFQKTRQEKNLNYVKMNQQPQRSEVSKCSNTIKLYTH